MKSPVSLLVLEVLLQVTLYLGLCQLCRSCAGNESCYEFTGIVVLSCPEILFHSSLL